MSTKLPRFYTPLPLESLAVGANTAPLELDAACSRHMQVHRLQPGDGVALFNGNGDAWHAEVTAMSRSTVFTRLIAHFPAASQVEEGHPKVTLAVCSPSNERMDWLVEKATELGASAIWPLSSERSVVRLAGERAAKRVAHWQAIAAAACAQSGRNTLPHLAPVQDLPTLLAGVGQNPTVPVQRFVLSLSPYATPAAQAFSALNPSASVLLLSGPEGGLSPAEEAAAVQNGFTPISLGRYTLRAETAPLLALAKLV